MPRPSLKAKRRKEILDAYVTCIAQYGLEGATQERIAEEAGIARPLLRHNLGNRDEMIAALVDHVVAEFGEMVDQIAGYATTLTELVELVFDPRYRTDPKLNLAFQALVAASAAYPEMRGPLLKSVERYTTLIAELAKKAAPASTKRDRDTVAHGVAAISMSSDGLDPLNPPPGWRAAQKRAALAIIDMIREPGQRS